MTSAAPAFRYPRHQSSQVHRCAPNHARSFPETAMPNILPAGPRTRPAAAHEAPAQPQPQAHSPTVLQRAVASLRRAAPGSPMAELLEGRLLADPVQRARVENAAFRIGAFAATATYITGHLPSFPQSTFSDPAQHYAQENIAAQARWVLAGSSAGMFAVGALIRYGHAAASLSPPTVPSSPLAQFDETDAVAAAAITYAYNADEAGEPGGAVPEAATAPEHDIENPAPQAGRPASP